MLPNVVFVSSGGAAWLGIGWAWRHGLGRFAGCAEGGVGGWIDKKTQHPGGGVEMKRQGWEGNDGWTERKRGGRGVQRERGGLGVCVVIGSRHNQAALKDVRKQSSHHRPITVLPSPRHFVVHALQAETCAKLISPASASEAFLDSSHGSLLKTPRATAVNEDNPLEKK